ncbi:DUF4838 domain-containing protein [Parapedobacter sp. SGR-10]|uniref:DUF4838 domain-containing protein n=1 Tax=Parapedobacter sp. SGR-10 TaxID=2710879 RepID=UPI0013D514E3|nr:DUF4838 domain-containing protein [Parapedobacter sp. SGR-10]NGF57148.1 DUF4838 domain-containing protein [Parapedobacter sp. SGR-10]
MRWKVIGAILAFIYCYGVDTLSAQTTLASNGKSDYRVLVPANAPRSVQMAAKDFLEMFQRSTGVQMPLIVENTYEGNAPFVSLGNTRQARDAGIKVEDLAEEGFRIVLSKGNLFIIGKDTPDGKTTKDGGISNGTANGIYTFLEEYLGARWLMPGELGKVVAKHETLVLKDINRTEVPLFVSRKLPYLDASWTMRNTSPAVNEWEQRQRLGYSINLWHSHNWQPIVPASMWEKHPDWFAMIDGKRAKPGFRYKLETTNPELIQYFADRAIEQLKKDKIPRTFSLSPSDSKGWSESPDSKLLYDPPAPGDRHPSMSSLVLKFYHDVAEIVQREYPEGKLAGYLYDSYLYPPTKVDMKLPDNFIPVIAPSSITYGFRLYHEKNKQEWQHVMRSWAKVAPEIWSYYDIPNTFNLWRITEDYDRFAGVTGIVTPPAAELLNFIFSGLVENKIRGGYLFGTPSWTNTAVANYMLAKMMWNPELDAYEVQRDWLHHAYGAAAGAEMEKFYNKLEDIYREYSKDKVISSRPNDAMFRDLYGKQYPEIEKLYLNAVSQEMDADQKTRLEMIGDNLAVLQWRLRNAGFLPEGFSSPLQRKTAQISDVLNKSTDAFPYFPEALLGWKQRDVEGFKHIPFVIAPSLSNDDNDNSGKLPLQDKNLIILHAEKNEDIQLHTRKVKHGSLFASCIIKKSSGEEVYRGLLDEENPINFRAEQGSTYYLYFPARPGTSAELEITGQIASVQVSTRQITARKQENPVYIHVPYQKKDAIIKTEQVGENTVRIVKINQLEKTNRLDPQD